MLGKILSTVGGIYVVYSNGINYRLFPKGIFRHKNQKLLVGDDVLFNDEEMVIEYIEERKNELIRPKVANIDMIFVTMSVVEPELSVELLYKFLTYANMNSIPASVIFTKVDKLSDKSHLEAIKNDLLKLNIKVYYLSKDENSEIDLLKNDIKSKAVVFMGQTGVGKSSAINAIDKNFERKIGEYSYALGRGKHQTKEVILFPYEDGFIADTPGFSSLDLNIFKEDLAMYFPGYNDLYTQCYFSNCLHQNEKQCKIKEEISKGNLSKEGYEAYIKLLDSLPYRIERFKK